VLNPSPFTILVQAQGELIRWLKALPCQCYDPSQNYDGQRNCSLCDHGWVYRDQGTQQGLVANQKRSVLHPELGWITQEDVTLTVMPDELRFGRFDKVVLLARTNLARELLHRGADVLGQAYPVAVNEVADGTLVYVAGTDYCVNLTTGVVTWMTGGPTNVYAVEYTYRPLFWFAESELRPGRPTGAGEVMTPQRGLLLTAPPEA